jgi:hypothetical protein
MKDFWRGFKGAFDLDAYELELLGYFTAVMVSVSVALGLVILGFYKVAQ